MIFASLRPGLQLPWPLPALLAWTLAWCSWWVLHELSASPAWALGSALLVGSALALRCRGRRRRALAALGFPLSAWVLGAASAWPAWAWLVLGMPLLLVYPLRAWRDAPFFPTPAAALCGLDRIVGRPARVLDAGCGLGHGLRALRQLWPQARLHGVEWSPLLAWLSARRCPWADIRRGDMWRHSWAGHDLVYVFQRPESMARVWDKAQAEMAAGAWLVSLEFAVPGQRPWSTLNAPGSKPLWIYRTGPARAGSIGALDGR